jgi:MFS transporter, MHS family, proline/betaine transporter
VTAGLIVGGIGFYLRKNLPETPDFLISQMQRELSKKPLVDALKNHPFHFIISIILSAYTGTATYTLLVFMAAYLQTHLAMSAKSALLITAFIGLIESLFSPLFGWLTDVIQHTKPMLAATISMMLLAIPVFMVLESTHSIGIMISLLSLLAFCLAAFDGPLSSFLPMLFPTAYRYSGTTVSFNIGGAMIGGFAPFWLSFLIAKTHHLAVPGFYLTGFATLSVFILLYYQWQSRSKGV